MAQQTLQILEQKLVAKGYSRRYARRLIGELADHYLHYEPAFEPTTASFEDRLGDIDVIVDVVSSFEELDPIPKRYPLVFFLYIPAILFTCLTVLMIQWIYGWIPAQDHERKLVAIENWNCAGHLFLFGVPAAAAWITARYKVSVYYLFACSVFLTATGNFWTTAAACSQSGSTFIYSRWEANWVRLLLPWAPVVVLLSRRLFFKTISVSPFFSAASFSSFEKHINFQNLASLASLAMLFAFFNLSVSWTLDARLRHPIDNLVDEFTSPVGVASRFLTAAEQYDQIAKLNPNVSDELNTLLERFEEQLGDIYSKRGRSISKKTQRKEIRQEADSLILKTHSAVSALLGADQKMEVDRLAMKNADWDVLFLNSVRDHIEFTDCQFQQFKDVYLESIKSNQSLMAKWKKAGGQERKEIADRIRELRRIRDRRLAYVLTAVQLIQLDSFCGLEKSRLKDNESALAGESKEAVGFASSSSASTQ